MNMREHSVRTKLEQYFLYFFVYSLIGWCYEVFLEVVVYDWGFSNRGVLFGPYCVVYGFGALLLILTLQKLQAKKIRIGKINITPVLVFLAIISITTFVELIASYIMEFTTGGWLWDYTRFAFDFQGRIAPNPSIRFGIGGMVFLYILQPLLVRITCKIPEKKHHFLALFLAFLMLCDCVYTFFLK